MDNELNFLTNVIKTYKPVYREPITIWVDSSNMIFIKINNCQYSGKTLAECIQLLQTTFAEMHLSNIRDADKKIIDNSNATMK